jgi:hypothetical protein
MQDAKPATPPKAPYRGGIFFFLFCAAAGFAPLIAMILFTPIAAHFGCSGNEGTGVTCKGAPGLSSMAAAIFGLGIWGCFFTLPAAAVLFLIGMFAGVMSPSEEIASMESESDLSWTLDAHGKPQTLYCPSCAALVPPEEYQGICQQCYASFGPGAAWRPSPRPVRGPP